MLFPPNDKTPYVLGAAFLGLAAWWWLRPLRARIQVGDHVFVSRVQGPLGPLAFGSQRLILLVTDDPNGPAPHASLIGIEGMAQVPEAVQAALLPSQGVVSYNPADVTRADRLVAQGRLQTLHGSV